MCMFFFFFFGGGGGGVLDMPDIFWGGPSDQIFFGGTEQMLGPSLYAYKQMFRVSPLGSRVGGKIIIKKTIWETTIFCFLAN